MSHKRVKYLTKVTKWPQRDPKPAPNNGVHTTVERERLFKCMRYLYIYYWLGSLSVILLSQISPATISLHCMNLFVHMSMCLICVRACVCVCKNYMYTQLCVNGKAGKIGLSNLRVHKRHLVDLLKCILIPHSAPTEELVWEGTHESSSPTSTQNPEALNQAISKGFTSRVGISTFHFSKILYCTHIFKQACTIFYTINISF